MDTTRTSPSGPTTGRLEEQVAEIERLLARHRTLESVARRQQTARSALLEEMQHRQNLVVLQRRLRAMHPADVANLLETQPTDDRLLIWRELPARLAAQALVEVSAGVREALIEATSHELLVTFLRELDADDVRYLSEWLPAEVMDDVAALLDAADRSWVEQSLAYPPGTAARLMTRDILTLRETQTVQETVDELRRRGRLPAQTDRLFVVDPRNLLIGAVNVGDLLIAEPPTAIVSIMENEIRRFRPDDEADEVSTAFDRYNLLSAPIVDDRGKLIGRVTADAVMDYIRSESESEVLALAGLRQAEDLFAPVADSARNRWPWLAVNLGTAFLASRIIGAFESTIQTIVALAALMPIVASIGGNTGNQTVALVVRGLALDQLKPGSGGYLLRKELVVSLLNGALWGTLVGLFAGIVYHSVPLALVMSSAVLLNLVVAALVGVLVPLSLSRLGRDPAQGSSVVLTFVTDGMGFFLFLGLARVFLV